jgi:rRNA processing protein Krr1/Pno1
MRLTTFFGQFRSVATNYNQIVKALGSNFTEKKALAFLYKLEKATLELVEIHKRVIELTEKFEERINDN